jgi:hypothetical protein
MDRYIGHEVKLNLKFDETKFIWIKREDWDLGNKRMCNPAFWFENRGWIYFGICKSYHFHFLEDFSDWDNFNEYEPNFREFDHLMSLKPKFYKLDYPKALSVDKENWCKFETDFIKEWWRDKQIDDIIK